MSEVGIICRNALALTLLALCSCGTIRRSPEISAEVRARIYARAEENFRNVFLLKPLADMSSESNIFKLAPLILQEAPDGQANKIPATNASPLFVSERTIRINGRAHQQVSFYWRTGSRSSRNSFEGFRITEDAQNRPAIWEVLADSSGAEIIFVSQSVEAEAMREFGSPFFPGRGFSVECKPSVHNKAIVARVIEDGPIPMGPIVYERSNGDIHTVICRCMPAQATNVLGQIYFWLQSLNANEERALVSDAATRSNSPVVPPDSWLSPGRLESLLRLPNEF